MSYPMFEFLALTVGSISIIFSLVTTLWSGVAVQETVAQGLLLVVLVGAVHRGKRGGLATGTFAIIAYLGMRAPLIARDGFTPEIVELVLVRTLTYAAVGIGGGAVCARIHHFLARFESTPTIDSMTQLFNEYFVTRTLRKMVQQYERFHKPFSVVILTLEGVTVGNPDAGKVPLLRELSTFLREHVRLIDDVARLDDGRLILVLPQTDRHGAAIAADRISRGVARMTGGTRGVLGVEIMGAVEDLEAIRQLCGADDPGAIARPDATTQEPERTAA